MKQAVLAICALAGTASAEVNTGWSVGSGGKIYGGAREACDAFLKDTASGGVKYVVERLEPTDAGDQTCWFKNSKDEGTAVTQTLIYRVRRTSFEGVPIYRGTSEARRREATTTLEHDLGPGIYYAKESWVARAYAQAAFLDAYIDRGTKPVAQVPDGVVYEYDFKAPKDIVDFSQGKPLADFEKIACTTLGVEAAERMFDGEVNPAHYYKAFVAYAASQSKKPADWKVVIGPDYRFSIAGNGQQDPELNCDTKPADRLPRRQPQIRINDKTLTGALDKKATASLETRFPSKEDVAAAMVGHQTTTLFAKCAGTAKTGACATHPQGVGRLLFLRRRWQATPYYVQAKAPAKGNHWYLRIGETYIDGAFIQFDTASANSDRGELFVGTRGELIQRLGNFAKPAFGLDGEALFAAFWSGEPFRRDGVVPRLVYREASANRPLAGGEAMWDREPSGTYTTGWDENH